ncbi:hypothetical protein PFISCL1PPCAC_9422, partial [Pristionchus fissidentatus]
DANSGHFTDKRIIVENGHESFRIAVELNLFASTFEQHHVGEVFAGGAVREYSVYDWPASGAALHRAVTGIALASILLELLGFRAENSRVLIHRFIFLHSRT